MNPIKGMKIVRRSTIYDGAMMFSDEHIGHVVEVVEHVPRC